MTLLMAVAFLFAGLILTPASQAWADPGLPPSGAAPPPPTNLVAVVKDADHVRLTWTAANDSLELDKIDGYLVFRDRVQIANLKGQNNVIPTAYTDTPPPLSTSSYTVKSYSTTVKISEPSNTAVATLAPVGNEPDPNAQADNADKVSGASFCSLIKHPSLEPTQRPTPAEAYSCTQAMTDLSNDYGRLDFVNKMLNIFTLFLLFISVGFQLLTAAIFNWTLLSNSYVGLATAITTIINNFSGNANYFRLKSLFFAIGIFVMLWTLSRGNFRRVAILILSSLAVLGGLQVFAAHTSQITNRVVSVPLDLANGTLNTLGDLSSGTPQDRNYMLSVVPTYGKDPTIAARRKMENQDWIIHSYIPRCALEFGDPEWAMNTKAPDHGKVQNMSWCEASIVAFNQTDESDRNFLMDNIQKANPAASEYFHGHQPLMRTIFAGTVLIDGVIHNGLKLASALVILGGIIFGLFEVMLGFVWLLASLTGFQSARDNVARRAFGLLSLVISVVGVSAFVMLAYLLQAYVYSFASDQGFLVTLLVSLIFNVVALVMLVNFVRQSRRRRHEFADQQWGPRKHAGTGAKLFETVKSGLTGAAAGGAAGAAAAVVVDQLETEPEVPQPSRGAPYRRSNAQLVVQAITSNGPDSGGTTSPPRPGPPPPQDPDAGTSNGGRPHRGDVIVGEVLSSRSNDEASAENETVSTKASSRAVLRPQVPAAWNDDAQPPPAKRPTDSEDQMELGRERVRDRSQDQMDLERERARGRSRADASYEREL